MKCTRLCAVALVIVMTLTACTTSWVAEAEAIVTALVPAVTNILTLVAALENKTVSAQDLAIVQNVSQQANADFQLVGQLLSAYNAAPAAQKPDILNKVQAAIGDAQSNLGSIMASLHIKDPATQAKIESVLGIVDAEIQSVEALLPLVQGKTGAVRGGARIMTAKQFKKTFNAELRRPSGSKEVDDAVRSIR